MAVVNGQLVNEAEVKHIRDVLALDEACFLQALVESHHEVRRIGERRSGCIRRWVVLAGRLRLHTLRNELRRTLRHLQQQLRRSSRASTSSSYGCAFQLQLRLTLQSIRTVQLLPAAFQDFLLTEDARATAIKPNEQRATKPTHTAAWALRRGMLRLMPQYQDFRFKPPSRFEAVA
jgi:hypothetical protein